MIEGWFGQVGLEIHTVACGEASLISSSACRMAPVPPGGWGGVTARRLQEVALLLALQQGLRGPH